MMKNNFLRLLRWKKSKTQATSDSSSTSSWYKSKYFRFRISELSLLIVQLLSNWPILIQNSWIYAPGDSVIWFESSMDLIISTTLNLEVFINITVLYVVYNTFPWSVRIKSYRAMVVILLVTLFQEPNDTNLGFFQSSVG